MNENVEEKYSERKNVMGVPERIYDPNEISRLIKKCDGFCYGRETCNNAEFRSRLGIVCHVYKQRNGRGGG